MNIETEVTSPTVPEAIDDLINKQSDLEDMSAERHEVTQLSDNDDMESAMWTDGLSWLQNRGCLPSMSDVTAPLATERRLDDDEWAELLESVDCMEYISPDIEACMGHHRQFEVEQELELTGREFLQSPVLPSIHAISTLKPLNSLRRGRRASGLPTPSVRQQSSSSRRFGLRERQVRQNIPAAVPVTQLQTLSKSTVLSSKSSNFIEHATEARVPDENKVDSRFRYQPLLRLDIDRAQRNREERHSFGGRPSASNGVTTQRRCQTSRKSKDCIVPGCTKGARSKGLCKRHGGGKRCTHPECTRSDQGGGFCIAHGGGKRCASTGCKNSAQSRGLCKSHGGGKRCAIDGCIKSSQEGGLCRGHGGGKLCKTPNCSDIRLDDGFCMNHNRPRPFSNRSKASTCPEV